MGGVIAWRNSWVTRRALGLALTVVLLVDACAPPAPLVVVHTAAGTVSVAVELARTEAEQQQGLMFRTVLADGHGMLFIFPEVGPHPFWMKNTPIPLDIVFIAADRHIAAIHPNATPLSTAPIGAGIVTRWVLEVSGGFAARRGIAAGDPVELPAGIE